MKTKVVQRGPFKTALRRIRGKGGWTYVTIPKKLAPPITRAWARTPVRASIDFQGTLFVGGGFTTAGGIAAQNVARWNGTSWQPAGAGLDGTVWAFAEHQGQLYAAGEFGQFSAGPKGIARWDGANWQPVGGGLTWNFGVYAVGYGLGDRIEAIRHALGRVEHAVGAFLVVATLALLAWRAVRRRRAVGR